MIFPTEFRSDLMARPADAETLEGLRLVEEKINDVITAINKELDQFDPEIFQKDGEIKPQSFGDTDRAPLLALHHRRAHQVTASPASARTNSSCSLVPNGIHSIRHVPVAKLSAIATAPTPTSVQ